MKVLIDIGHPAHVHYYRNAIRILSSRGVKFFVVARKRGVVHELLEHYGIDYVSRGEGSKKFLGKLSYGVSCLFQILKHSISFKPDVLLSQGGMYTSPIAFMINKKSVVTEDTENADLSHLSAKLFRAEILSPSCFEKTISKRQVFFDSYQELFYLHPQYYRSSGEVRKYLGLKSQESYVIVRFVDWNAHHDVGHHGFTIENKFRIVEEFTKTHKVFVLSEKSLPEKLKRYQIRIPSHLMHEALDEADLLFGESSTMASESACLGTPAFFIDKSGRGYTNELEKKYNLVYNFKDDLDSQDKAIAKAIEILRSNGISEKYEKRRMQLVQDKIDPTEFLVQYIENLNRKS